jgi:hypothetical protein
MNLRFTLVVVAVLLLVACQNLTLKKPNAVLATLELPMGNSLQSQALSMPNESGLVFTPSDVAAVCTDVASNLRYLFRTFTVQNNSGATLTNLQLHAYDKSGNLGGSALKNIADFGGNPAPDISQVVPRHGMNCSTVPFVPDSNRADLQLYSSSQISNRTTLAGAALSSGEDLLGYGYLVRQRSTPNADNLERTLASGESGTVTVGLRVPNTVGAAYSFTMTFLVFADDTSNELVQAPEDQLQGTTAGLSSLPSGVARVSVLGGAACGLSGANRFQSAIRLAMPNTGAITESELDAPTINTIVTDNNAVSFPNGIFTTPDGGAVCYTQSITAPLNFTVEIDKNIHLLGGENVVLRGNGLLVLKIAPGNLTVKISGLSIEDGTNNLGPAAGIQTNSTLILRGSTIRKHFATLRANLPVAVKGGGVYSTASVKLFYSRIADNIAAGSTASQTVLGGSPGYSGGAAYGGGIYITGASSVLTLVASSIDTNKAFGGAGEMGCPIMFEPPPPFSPGGNGGEAAGGGVYLENGATVVGGTMVQNNQANGASGSPGCGGAPSGTDGASGSANIAP